jgi:hypothetical protein
MSPTVLRVKGYRFYFFSREVAQNWGLSKQRLMAALRLAREHADEIRSAWQTHFGS